MKLKNLFGAWIHRGALAGASLTVLLGAGSASAQPVCETPTLATCQGKDYLKSTCGQQYSTLCNELIGQEFQRQWATLTTETVTLIPESLGGGLATVRPMPYSELGSTYMDNGGGTYVGTVLKNQVLYRKNFQNLSPNDIAQRDALQQWEARGTTVRGCDEFVHKKFNDYSKFEDALGAHGADYRKIFQAAYAQEGGIAYKTLKGKEGNVIAPIFDGVATAPKNLYFLAEQAQYPEGMQGHMISPALLQLVPVEGRQAVTPSWQWHKQMSDSLANSNDAVLDRLFVKQLAFSALLDERKTVWNDYTRKSQKVTGEALTQLKQQVTQKLTGLNQALEAKLQEAQADNCLTMSADPACNWSPRRFKVMLDAAMMPRREADHAQCTLLTGNDFTEASFVRNASALGIPGFSGDYSLSPGKLIEYMNTYRQAIMLEPRLIIAATKETRRSDSRTSSASFGNSTFGSSYELSAGWRFDTISTGSTCESFSAEVYGYLEANARVFSTNREILYAGAEATATQDQLGYDAIIRVLGADVFHETRTYTTSFSVGPDYESPRATFFRGTAYFTIMGVPVSVSGGVSGRVGLDTDLTGQLMSGCRFQLGAEVTPWARLDGFVEVAIDVVVAAAGVRGELTLLKVEVPHLVTLAVFLESSGSSLRLMFELDTNLQLKLTTLDGSIYIFVRAFGLTAEKKIAEFNGITSTTTLLNETRTVPLTSFF